MNIEQLVKQVKSSQPSLNAVSDAHAAALLAAAFQRICDEIDGTTEGVVRVARLGRFNVKQTQGEKDGRPAKVKRVSFRPQGLE
jgi:hypothetical protein